MVKVALNILALTRSPSKADTYLLVLEEAQGNRRLPIEIGRFEAQAIAMGLEEIKTARPMTHDLMLHILEKDTCELKEVIVSDFVDGVFHGRLIIQNQDKIEDLDARCSDAIALAIRKSCPIFTYEKVLKNTSFSSQAPSSDSPSGDSLEKMSLPKLQELLDQAIASEAYERAQLIQEVMNRKKGGAT